MGFRGKLEVEYDLKSSAEQFYGFWRKEPERASYYSPENIRALKINWDPKGHGYTATWDYFVRKVEACEAVRKELVLTNKVEFDDKSMRVDFIGLEGDILRLFNIINYHFYITAKENRSSLKLVLEYESRNETILPPSAHFDTAISVVKDVDEGLTHQIKIEKTNII